MSIHTIYKFLLQVFLYLMLLFSFSRILFVAFQYFNSQTVSMNELCNSLLYGLYMDLSLSSGFIIISILIILFQTLIKKTISLKFISFLALFTMISYSTIAAFDIVLYKEWGYRLDETIFLYLSKIHEATNFVRIRHFTDFFIAISLLILISFYLYKKLNSADLQISNKLNYLSLILLLGLAIVPLRGGIGLAPLNPSMVYHSKLLYSNHISINPLWNLIYTYTGSKNMGASIKYMSEDDANRYFNSFNKTCKDSFDLKILNRTQPNILVIFLESFTSNLIHKKYNDSEICPNLNKWIKKGVYLDHAYASGDRTDKGLPAVLSAYPSQCLSSIIKFSSKSDKLPSILKVLQTQNYNSRFYYGGDLDFAGMKSYLLSYGFQKLIDKSSFPSHTYNAKWGVHDHILFESLYNDFKQLESPFFIGMLSLSSHSPYDLPEKKFWDDGLESNLFINSIHYTDKHLGILLDSLKNSPYWKNLVVVLVADHGVRYPVEVQNHQKEKFHIPILFTGGAISVDTIISKVCSQTDIASTLLSQMNLNYEQFKFSRNILSKNYKPFAYYAFNNGIGWVETDAHLIISNDSQEVIDSSYTPIKNINFVKSYYQIVLNDYLSK